MGKNPRDFEIDFNDSILLRMLKVIIMIMIIKSHAHYNCKKLTAW